MGRSVEKNRTSLLHPTSQETFMNGNAADQSIRLNVTRVMEKYLKYLKPQHSDILNLKSVKAAISALGDTTTRNNSRFADLESKIQKTKSLRESLHTPNLDFGSDIDFRSISTSLKHPTFQKVASESANATSVSDIRLEKVSLMELGSSNLIHKFDNLYTCCVAKNHVFKVKPRKASKSNFFGVLFSILALIFYFELHTINGFSRLWLKWKSVDLSSVEIDHVINPSWQGQVKGIKRWFLQPPPECYYECELFHVIVHPGEIIVLDTNKWYHQTQILPGENSITIGSEFD